MLDLNFFYPFSLVFSELKNADGNAATNNEEKKTESESKKEYANLNDKIRSGATNGTASLTEKSADEERWKEVFKNLLSRVGIK